MRISLQERALDRYLDDDEWNGRRGLKGGSTYSAVSNWGKPGCREKVAGGGDELCTWPGAYAVEKSHGSCNPRDAMPIKHQFFLSLPL